MRKIFHILLKAGAVLLLLLIAAVALLYVYVARNQDRILARIEDQFSQSCHGRLLIGSVRPDLFSEFPNVALSIRDLSIRDTLWEVHHHDLLRVARMDVTANVWALIRGRIEVHKLSLRQGGIYLFDDTTGYTNRSVFRKQSGRQGKPNSMLLRKLELHDFDVTIVNDPRRKTFDFHIERLKGQLQLQRSLRLFRTQALIDVRQCVFNRDKGSFLKNKKVRCDLSFSYDTGTRILRFDPAPLHINGNTLRVAAVFDFKQSPELFDLEIGSERLFYNEALSWLSPNISQRLDSFRLRQPVGLQVSISGRLRDQPTPHISLTCQAMNNVLETAAGDFEDCSFTGSFDNGLPGDTLFGDHRSVIRLYGLNARWNDIAFRSDSFVVYNLKAPRVNCALHSRFQVSALNSLLGGKTFVFDRGTAAVDLAFRGSMNPNDTISSHLDGAIAIDDARVSYVPRKLSFDRCTLRLEFRDQDIILTRAAFNSAGSNLQLSASAPRFLALYHKDPALIVLDTRVSSRRLDLNEFRSFIGRRSSNAAKVRTSMLASRIDSALDACTVHMNLDIRSLRYRRFTASNISGRVSMLPSGIGLDKITLLHAGGSVGLQGFIYQDQDVINAFRISSRMNGVAVDQLFSAFDNFGQQTLHAENIRGHFSMDGHISGRISQASGIVPGSLKGAVQFRLEEGALIGFKPLERMGRFAFRKKRLSEVRFRELSNTFGISGNEISIPPMMIASDLITMKVQGVYNLGIGTDLQMEIPVAAGEDLNLFRQGLDAIGGLRLHIRGKDDEQGNLHFSLNWGDKTEREKRKAERKARKDRRREEKAAAAALPD